MSERSAVLLDNTTIDAAIRLLSPREIQRRRDVGWCLRDISDLSCLSSFLDALIYFDELYVIPVGVLPSTAPITSSDSPIEQLRQCVSPVSLDADWEKLNDDAQRQVGLVLDHDPGLLARVPMLEGIRTNITIQTWPDGTIRRNESGPSGEDKRLALQRAILYQSAATCWKNQFQHARLFLWLSPDRYALLNFFNSELEQAKLGRENFAEALAGALSQLVLTAPNLIAHLVMAARDGVGDFGSYLVQRIYDLRRRQELQAARSLFIRNLARPIPLEDLKRLVDGEGVPEWFTTALSLIPGVGNYVEFIAQCAERPAMRFLNSLTWWQSDSRILLRSVGNECRALGVGEVESLTRKFFAGSEKESFDLSMRLGYCVKKFKNALAGCTEWDEHDVANSACFQRQLVTPQPADH